MQSLETPECDKLLFGTDGFSDASVYRLDDGSLLVQSLDFFPPLVDDPFLFGQIAAANSLSDIFAMGASPVTALNIVAFPDDKLPLDVLVEILRGGDNKVREAGAITTGGHTVRDAEIKYGLSVTGLCTENTLLHNSGALVGDVLVLTKPLGTGFVTTAMKARRASELIEKQAIESMTALNQHASTAAQKHLATSVTDITGFGLAGHAIEMSESSNITIKITVDSLPELTGAIEAYKSGYVTRASKTNMTANSSKISGLDVSAELKSNLLFDPQTSGGLLVSLPSANVASYINDVASTQFFKPVVIGKVIERGETALVVV